MKKNITINKLIREILKEQEDDKQLYKDVNTMIDLLDWPCTTSDLRNAYKLLTTYSTNGKGKEFLDYYQKSGTGGGDLRKSLKYLYVKEPESVSNREKMYKLIDQIEKGGSTSTDDSGYTITWDDGGTVVPPPKPEKSIYHDCPGDNFPIAFGCRKSPKIKEIQVCLGLESKYQTGNFGPITLKKLSESGYDMSSNVVDENTYNTIKGKCKETVGPRITDAGVEPITAADTTTSTPPDKITTPQRPTQTGPTGSELYSILVGQDLINGSIGDNRVKYKGPDLDNNQLNSLNDYMKSEGYKLIKNKDKGTQYGFDESDKYVWEQQ